MLDLYLIEDIQPEPDSPEESRLKHLGAVGKHEFRDLQKMGVMSLKQDYWSDFRWSSKKVLEILASLEEKKEEHKKQSLNFYKPKLLEILRTASAQSAGIIAFCD